MTFVLSEVLLQALTLMNSPQQRGRRAHAETPRRLRRIVLTLPTGIAARRAPDLPQARRGGARPRVDDDGLEARRSGGAGAARTDGLGRGELHPLVYLYTEVARNFGGDARRFFQITSKPRGRPADGTLSIASIDVGGGTTDLIIKSYPPRRRRHLGDPVSRAEVPRRFQRGGRRHPVARRAGPIVLPPIEAAMRAAGIANPTDLMAELVGRATRGGEDVIQRNLRQQFALQIAHPLALEFMRGRRDLRSDIGRRRGRAATLRLVLLRRLQAVRGGRDLRQRGRAAKRGAKDFDLKTTVFPVDLPSLDKTVRAEMARVAGTARRDRTTPTIATCCCCRAGRRACRHPLGW